MPHSKILLATLLPVFVVFGCVRVGRDFPATDVPDIEIGETTRADVRVMFGEPWRTGIENGDPTWTFGRYEYKLFGETETKDLVIRFDSRGVVSGYSFNRSNPQE
ncbi:MAG: hypothetical protein CME06_08200 [Gemmatimonadetes bacterium]|nr:hypothetical protein [Gemmatimonadota bacterium]